MSICFSQLLFNLFSLIYVLITLLNCSKMKTSFSFSSRVLFIQTMANIIPSLFTTTQFETPDLLESAHNLNQDILGGTMLLVGLFATFFGAKFFKYMIFFIGFILGGFLAYFATPTIYSWVGYKVQDDTLLYISLVFGAFTGILLVVIYKAAVFAVGAIAGAVFSQVLWIAVVANVDTPNEDYMIAIQIGVLIAFALIGGYLAFKFVKQVMKAVTAFLGAFMFASGVAYFISRIDTSDERNVIDWVVFFGAYQNYANLDDVCDAYCIVCVILWVVMFAAGLFVQYKLFKKEDDGKSKDKDEYETDSSDGDSESESVHKHKKNKRKRSGSSDDSYSDGNSNKRQQQQQQIQMQQQHQYNDYDANNGSYAGSQYAASSIRQNHNNNPNVLGSYSNGQQPPEVAMSAYEGQNYYNSQNGQPQSAPGQAQSLQYV